MLGGNNLISQPSLTTAKASYQNLAIGNRGPGGAAKRGPPPRPRSEVRRRPARRKITGSSDTRWYPVDKLKKHKKWYTMQFQKLPQKTRSSSRWNFSSGSLSTKELAVSLRGCVGQVDAEKLAQRSSVVAWRLSYWTECPWGHLNSPDCLWFDWLPILNLFTG
jgi:hypothetical protein